MFSQTDVAVLQKMHDASKRIEAMRHTRAVAAFCRAFGHDPSPDSRLDMCIIHNALLSFEDGKPWRDVVDYSQLRLARRLTNDFTASRLVTSWYRRKCGLPTE